MYIIITTTQQTSNGNSTLKN